MPKMSNTKCLSCICALVLTGLASAVLMAEAGTTPTTTAITQPSQKLKIAFGVPGVVKIVDVKEGDLVKTGQVLMNLDDRIEAKLLEAKKLESDSLYEIDYAKADLAIKRVQLIRKEQLKADDHGASDTEVEEARLAVILGDTRVNLAELEHQKKKLEAEQQAIKVELMHLLSPIDGAIEKLEIGPGETADPSKPAVTLVKNDPLWVEIHLPSAQAELLKKDELVDVRYSDQSEWTASKVIYLDPQADAASGTRLVRMELANSANRASGRQVLVRLPAKLVAGAKDLSMRVERNSK